MTENKKRAHGHWRKSLLKFGCYAGFLCGCFCLSSPVYPQGALEPALPDGDGKDLTTFVCSQCHGLRETELLRDGEKGWRDTVNRMVLYGAQMTPAEADRVTHYLATHLGQENQAPDKGAAGSQTSGEETAGAHRGQQSIAHSGAKRVSLPAGPGKELVASRCAQCHSLEKAVNVNRTNADWDAVTYDMVERGMHATPDEVQAMLSYLKASFGA